MNWSDYPKEMQRKTEMSKRMADLAARGRAVTYGMKRAVMSRLLRAWDAAPALRLGQFLVCVCEQHAERVDLFHVEDERLAALAEAKAVVPEAETLTPSEKALAKMLDAAIEWNGADVGTAPIPLLDIVLSLRGMGLLTTQGEATSEGADLLARARKAGVL